MEGDIYRLAGSPPPAEAYAFALSRPFVKAHHRAMLAAHGQAPDLTITAGALAAAAGYSRWGPANLHYGTLARRVAELLEIRPAGSSTRTKPLWTTALAEGWRPDDPTTGGQWRWRLYPEVAAALRELGITNANGYRHNDRPR